MRQTMHFPNAFNYSAYALHSFCINNTFDLHHENYDLHHENYDLHHENYDTPKNGATIDATDFYFLPIYITPFLFSQRYENTVLSVVIIESDSFLRGVHIYGSLIENQLQSIESIFAIGLLSLSKTIEMYADESLYFVDLMQNKVDLMQNKVDLMQNKVDNAANKIDTNIEICKV